MTTKINDFNDLDGKFADAEAKIKDLEFDNSKFEQEIQKMTLDNQFKTKQVEDVSIEFAKFKEQSQKGSSEQIK